MKTRSQRTKTESKEDLEKARMVEDGIRKLEKDVASKKHTEAFLKSARKWALNFADAVETSGAKISELQQARMIEAIAQIQKTLKGQKQEQKKVQDEKRYADLQDDRKEGKRLLKEIKKDAKEAKEDKKQLEAARLGVKKKLIEIERNIKAEDLKRATHYDGKPIFIKHFNPDEKADPKTLILLPTKKFNISYTAFAGTDDAMARHRTDGRVINLSKKEPHQRVVKNVLLGLLINADHNYVSEVPEQWLDDIDIREVTDAKLDRVRNKASGMIYPPKLLGDLSAINVNPGECVLDYIMAEFNKRKMRLTRVQLIEELGGVDEVKDGISVSMIRKWLYPRSNISMYALDPFGTVFDSRPAPGRCDLMLVFIVNNQHVYPILDDAVKNKVAHAKRLSFREFTMTTDWSDIGEWKLSLDYEKHDLAKPEQTNNTLLISGD